MLAGILTIIVFNQSFSQQITENAVPLEIQSYLYLKYPASEVTGWSLVEKLDGNKLYQASIEYQGNSLKASFKKDGTIVYENLQYGDDNAPKNISEHATDNFENYKVVSIHKHTNFDYGDNHSQRMSYELVVKSGKEITSVWFDQNLMRQDSFGTENLVAHK